jgi:hypothetical protein
MNRQRAKSEEARGKKLAKTKETPIAVKNTSKALTVTDTSRVGFAIISQAEGRRSLFEDASMLLVFERLELLKERKPTSCCGIAIR